MSSSRIDEFARKLVDVVRDEAIKSCDLNLREGLSAVTARRWKKALADSAAPGEATRVIVPDAIDEAIFFLLNAIDQGAIRLVYVADDGESVDLSESGLGELAGWYIGPGGWRSQHSGERVLDFVGDDAEPLT